MNPATPAPKPKKRSRVTLTNVAVLLIATSFAGQLLGFLRTKLVNANFPVTGPNSTDAYFAAFNIPDFIFFTVSAGALGVAFMPILSDHLHKRDRKGVWELSASLLNLLAIIMFVIGIIIFVFAEPLIRHIVAPHMAEEQIKAAASIMRFLAFNPLLFTISGILTSVQQTMGRFFFYAIAPLFYNTAIIVSIFLFRHNLGLEGLGLGALIGAILQLIIIALGTAKLNFHWHPKILWRSRDFRQILRNLPARSLDQGMDQLQSIVETRFASRLGSGAVTYYNNAYILSTAPILLIGTAISTAAFPRLNARLSQGRHDLFRRDFLMVLRAMIWITMPIIVICYFCRGYLARLIYANGNEQIAVVFGYLTLAIFFRIVYAIVSRWFYSQKDTKTPLLVSIFTISLNVILAYSLAKPEVYGVAGLALAQSIVAVVEVAILFAIMLLRDPKLFDWKFISGCVKIVSVTGFSVVAGIIMLSIYPLTLSDRGFVTLGTKLTLIAIVVLLTHIAVSSLFGLEEVRPVLRRARNIILKPVKVDVS
jgi:putative peptidoglycan lipid II flippase